MTHEAQTDLRERLALIAQNKMADHLRIEPDEPFNTEAEFMEIEGTGPASYAIADAVLAIARPAIIEECAKRLDASAQISSHLRDISTLERAAARLRALAEKP